MEKTILWQKAFGPRDDGHDPHRETLAHILRAFRGRASSLVQLISRDMAQYTVHDITHLDALWETASIIAGEAFDINPAEAFVFGGSVLLHDAGMTLAAYPKGEQDLRSTPEWEDSVAAARRLFPNKTNVKEEELLQHAGAKDYIINTVLREAHAKVAESLACNAWSIPGSKEQQYLLEPTEIRAHFGSLIGLVAASHHWPVERLVKKFTTPLGAHTEHPSSWSVNALKVALLLRCADAAHIDNRRAPRLLFALNRPTGISLEHWRFQSKLTKVQINGEKLIYTSSSSFTIDECDAWQLAWDSIRLIDSELRSADDVFQMHSLPRFSARAVEGAISPEALSRTILVDGWTPILPNIQVSDVAHLARTLGGRDLYDMPLAPLRELLQNAADAIDARSQIDNEFRGDDSRFVVRFHDEDENGEVVLEIEDNGIGMSERILVGPLIDFGVSFWKSHLAKQEYPGLQARFRTPRGKFGIGFFSVFMWADEVTIFSKPYRSGREQTNVLEFRGGLGRRPLLRRAKADEQLGNISTRVRIRIPRTLAETLPVSFRTPRFLMRDSYKVDIPTSKVTGKFQGAHWAKSTKVMAGCLEIPVHFEHNGVRTLINLPDWRIKSDIEAGEYFSEMLFTIGLSVESKKFELRPVNFAGSIVGRSQLWKEGSHGLLFVFDKGIFVEARNSPNKFGFIEGAISGASREHAVFSDPSADEAWLKGEVAKLEAACVRVGDFVAMQEFLTKLGFFNREYAVFILNGEFCSFSTVLSRIEKSKQFCLRLVSRGSYDDTDSGSLSFKISNTTGLSAVIGPKIDPIRVHFLVQFDNVIFGHETLQEFIDRSKTTILSGLLQDMIAAVGEGFSVRNNIWRQNSYSAEKLWEIIIDGISSNTH